MLAGVHGGVHESVPRRIEYDFVDALAEAIVRPELGDVAVRARGELEGLRASQPLAPRDEAVVRPRRVFRAQPLAQRPIREIEIAILERRRLVRVRRDHGNAGFSPAGVERTSVETPCTHPRAFRRTVRRSSRDNTAPPK